ncbi:allantoate amidohydrolase [Rubrobacter marinus]|uniref:Allantoate amidohydrolase n=2 Tax=Rubrobacter marinus TaxID=2653852 RepID=A0A6G8Q2Y6_9ACTN|nr:allantoate amidohydrolase [Rubrobacter marinus]
MERCDALGGISEEPDLLVRPYGSGAMRRVNEIVADWMQTAGMSVRRDAVGNLIGRYEAREGDGGTLVLGSHLDTVRDAGRYDGPLGVLVALACVERLNDRGERLPFAVEVAAFADEEGLRFGTTFLGSSVFAGTFEPGLLDLVDGDGVTVAEAVRSFGGDPGALAGGRPPDGLIGYCEVHIEQGPVLEELGLPVGVVTAIQGQSRAGVGFVGEAGHAGTVPMKGRRDALCAAAEFVLAAEETARGEDGAVATVGRIEVHPGAPNVIPGEASLTLDLRHADDAVRERALGALRERAEGIARARGVRSRWEVRQESRAVPTDEGLSATLARAVEETGLPAHRLASGAGHDAAEIAAVAPVAMLFVRCEGGVSHNPAESVGEEDVAVAIEAMGRFLELLAAERG